MLAAQTKTPEPDTLLAKLQRRIERHGPLTIADYMDACLSDPEFGYYATRDPFGRGGDFTTAPEISQIFGELIGLWCAAVWRRMGAPAPLNLIELGPGRGTLMADALRAARTVPAFLGACEVHLVETSPVLRRMQGERLAASGKKPCWHDALSDVPEGPALLIANEFLDALPVRQFQRKGEDWFERCVGLSVAGGLAFCLNHEPLKKPDALPETVRASARDGDMAEIRPLADALANELAQRATRAPIAALFIDYGHAASAPGDTLQAVSAHDYADPLACPGDADLTAHVDFARLGAVARKCGLGVHGPLSQGEFLTALGLGERRARLVENAAGADQEMILSGAQRLVEANQMGTLFKAMALTSAGLAPPPFTPMPEAEPAP